MKTTIDIPDDVLSEAMKHTGAKTKRDAVVMALEDYNRRQQMSAMTKYLGTFDKFMTMAELNEARATR